MTLRIQFEDIIQDPDTNKFHALVETYSNQYFLHPHGFTDASGTQYLLERIEDAGDTINPEQWTELSVHQFKFVQGCITASIQTY